WMGPGRTVQVPDWLRSILADQLDTAVPGAELEFSGLRVGLGSDWQVFVALRDVELRGRGGVPMAEAGSLRMQITPLALMRGRAGISDVQMSDIALAVRRDTDGRLALAFEEALAAGGTMPDLTQLIAALDGVLTSAHLATLRSVEVDAVTLRYEDYRANRAWTADGGRLSLARDLGSGALSLRGDFAVLTGGSGVATVAMTAASVVGQNDVTLSIAVADVPSEQIATQSAALAWLGAVRAPISGSFRAHLRPNGHLGPLNGTLQAGQGVVQPDPGARPIPFDAARSYVTYDPDTGGLRFDELSVQADWGRVRIVGQASLEGYGTELAPLGTEPDALPLNIMPSNALPDTLSGQFRVSELSLNPNALFDAPLTLTRGAEVDLHLALNPFTLRLGRIWVDDDRLPLHASGVVRADPSGWTVSLDGRVDQIDAQDVLSFWPPEFQAKPR
ncbi:MAG: hypothetical protein ACPGFC_10000, partial [Paracoccaceae bacterium]